MKEDMYKSISTPSVIARLAKNYSGEKNRSEIKRLYTVYRDQDAAEQAITRLHREENLFGYIMFGYRLSLWLDSEINNIINLKP